MRFYEFQNIPEGLSKASSSSQILKWLYNISSYINEFHENHILYRQFYTGNGDDQRPLSKVNNATQRAKDIKTGRNPFQAKVLEELKIDNPVFCRYVPPDSIESKVDKNLGTKHLGNNFIVIPPKNPRLLWSPAIYDLGEFYVNALEPKSGELVGLDPERLEDYIDSYQEVWPDPATKNEIILDARFYYLLNIESILRVVDDNINVSGPNKEFDQEKYLNRFRTYGDISDFITDDLTKIIKDAEKQIGPGIKRDKRAAKINRQSRSFIKKSIDSLLQKNENPSKDDVQKNLIDLGLEDSEIKEYMPMIIDYIKKFKLKLDTKDK